MDATGQEPIKLPRCAVLSFFFLSRAACLFCFFPFPLRFFFFFFFFFCSFSSSSSLPGTSTSMSVWCRCGSSSWNLSASSFFLFPNSPRNSDFRKSHRARS